MTPSAIGAMLVLHAFAAPGFCLETRPISAADLRTRVAMRTVFYGEDPVAGVRTVDFVLTQSRDGSKSVTGHSKPGKEWRLSLPAPTRGLWQSESGGRRTYYFAGYTGAAGAAPDTWILVLSFDEYNDPVPFYFSTYSGYDSRGIKDALDLDGTGPELLQQSWFETESMPKTRSGFYITTLYQRRGPYWYRADGRHGTESFPLYEKWTALRGTKPRLTAPPGQAAKWLTDLGNDPALGVRTRILSLGDHIVHLGPEPGCALDRAGVVISDSRTRRQIDLLLADFPGRLLTGIASGHSLITITGVNRHGDSRCGAAAVWAIGQ